MSKVSHVCVLIWAVLSSKAFLVFETPAFGRSFYLMSKVSHVCVLVWAVLPSDAFLDSPEALLSSDAFLVFLKPAFGRFS